jgi:hypothetical protein
MHQECGKACGKDDMHSMDTKIQKQMIDEVGAISLIHINQ